MQQWHYLRRAILDWRVAEPRRRLPLDPTRCYFLPMPIEPEISPPSLSADTEAALRRIAAAEGLRLLVVFGSLAAGRGTSESDLDIGVLAAEGRAAVAAVERRVLEEALHPRLDVVDLTRGSALLAHMVARTARVVYEAAPGVFASFASLALRRHEDARRFREADRAVIARFVAAHGGAV